MSFGTSMRVFWHRSFSSLQRWKNYFSIVAQIVHCIAPAPSFRIFEEIVLETVFSSIGLLLNEESPIHFCPPDLEMRFPPIAPSKVRIEVKLFSKRRKRDLELEASHEFEVLYLMCGQSMALVFRVSSKASSSSVPNQFCSRIRIGLRSLFRRDESRRYERLISCQCGRQAAVVAYSAVE